MNKSINSKFYGFFNKWYIPLLFGLLLIAGASAINLNNDLGSFILMLITSMLISFYGIKEIYIITFNKFLIKNWKLQVFISYLIIITGLIIPFAGLLLDVPLNKVLSILLLTKLVQNTSSTNSQIKRELGLNNTFGIYNSAILLLVILQWFSPVFINTILSFMMGFPLFILGIGCIAIALKMKKIKTKLNSINKEVKSQNLNKESEYIDYEIIN